MFLDRVIHFGENLGDQLKLRSLKKDPYVTCLPVKVVRYNIILISSPYCVPRLSCPFRGTFGELAKGRSPEKLKSFKELPYVLQVKEHVLSFNMILISFP